MLCLAFTCMALYMYFVSRHRILWSDELFGWMLLTDPDVHHMLAGWRAGADGGGLLFYLLGRLWLLCFGRSDMAFRAFSAAGCFAGFSFAWFALRRNYRAGLVAVTLFLVWFGSRTILWQMVQTRFYGMLLGAAAFALYVAIRSAQETATGAPARLQTLALNLLAHLLLVGTHPFGIAYSALILSGSALSDIAHRTWRPAFYLTGILPWSLLWFSREAMRNSARMGKPHFWTTTPTPDDLSHMYMPDAIPFIGYIALAFIVLTLLWPTRRRTFWRAAKQRSHILLPALLLSLTPLFLWIISQRGTSLFVDRYMVPFTLGIAVFGVEALTLIFPQGPLAAPFWLKFVGAGWIAYMLFCVAQDSVVDYPAKLDFPPLDFTPSLAQQLPRGIPVVFERPEEFDVMLHQQSAPNLPMFYLLDWDTAIAPESPRGVVSGYKEMETWRQVGYFSDSIVDSDKFLNTINDFIVVDDANILWFERRILHNPRWDIQKLSDYRHGFWSETIWKVHRRQP